jgi:DNA-binding GntR family transcriptional regulator
VSDLPGPPVKPRPYLREEIYGALRKHVMELAAGNGVPISLREADLARTLGVSRTPVREALNRLHQEGLVAVVPRRGVHVLPTTLKEYLSWLEIREVIEGMAAREAAARIAPQEIDILRGLFKRRTAEEYGPTGFAEANAVFHAKIIEVAKTPLLTRLSRTYDHFAGARLRITARLGRVEQSISEHHEIIDALERRDGAKAERLSRLHVRQVRAEAARALRSIEA